MKNTLITFKSHEFAPQKKKQNNLFLYIKNERERMDVSIESVAY